MRTKFKPWTVEYLKEHFDVNWTLERLEGAVILPSTYLEIGSGKGGFLVQMAKKYPEKTFLGIEKNITCAGITCKKIVEEKLPNVFIISEDIEEVYPLIKDETIAGIFLNFSDPWPKKRHAKRRLTSKRFLDNYYRILQKGGSIFLKTDNEELFVYTLKLLREDNRLNLVKIDENYDGLIAFDAETEYEHSFRLEGQNIYRLEAKKE
ncbi:MAG: tRNA (guanosine(46)-N7)-methyltransferase TrmB [Bacilli bacterium]